jgi:hypothetical protein
MNACSTNNYNTTTYNTYNNNNNIYSGNNLLIKIDTEDDYYINVSVEHSKIEYEYMIINVKNIYLFNINDELYVGLKLKIINSTPNIITLNAQNNQLIYSSFFTPTEGSNELLIKSNSIYSMYIVKNQDLFSWIMV